MSAFLLFPIFQNQFHIPGGPLEIRTGDILVGIALRNI
jgi:hypothetical protein